MTLYTIEQEKKLEEQNTKIKLLESQQKDKQELEQRLEKLEAIIFNNKN